MNPDLNVQIFFSAIYVVNKFQFLVVLDFCSCIILKKKLTWLIGENIQTKRFKKGGLLNVINKSEDNLKNPRELNRSNKVFIKLSGILEITKKGNTIYCEFDRPLFSCWQPFWKPGREHGRSGRPAQLREPGHCPQGPGRPSRLDARWRTHGESGGGSQLLLRHAQGLRLWGWVEQGTCSRSLKKMHLGLRFSNFLALLLGFGSLQLLNHSVYCSPPPPFWNMFLSMT